MFDIFIVAILLVNIFWGYKKGLILSLISFGSYIIAIIASKLYYVNLSLWLQRTTSIDTIIMNFIGKNIDGLISLWVPKAMPEEGTNSLWLYLRDYFSTETSLLTHTSEVADSLKTELSRSIASFVINIISIVLIFVIVRIVILIIANLLDRAFQLPLLNTMNRMGGGLVGGVRGILILLLALIILIPIALKNPSGKVSMAIEGSVILHSFLENWLVGFLNWLL